MSGKSSNPAERVDQPVAPHVAATVAALAGDDQSFAALCSTLSPPQLSGDAALPTVFAPTAEMRRASRIDELTAAERRLLVIASLSTVDLARVLIAAADVNADVILDQRMRSRIEIAHGRFRVIDERSRAVLLGSASPAELHAAHASLARVMRNAELPFAVWHESQMRGEVRRSARALTRLAEECLSAGHCDAAARIALRAAQLATDEAARARVFEVAARASFWSGRMADAAEFFRQARHRPALDAFEGDCAEPLAMIARLREGPEPHPTPIVRADEIVREITPWAASIADRDALVHIHAVIEEYFVSRDQADELLAGVLLSARPASSGRSWSTTPTGELSPFAEAHLRLLTAAFQARAGAFDEAGRTIAEASARLPLALPGGGVVSSLVEAIVAAGVPFDPALGAAWQRVGPRRRVVWADHGSLVTTRSTTAQASADPSADPRIGARQPALDLAALSRRERQVASAVADGASNRAIGEALGISDRTVEVHLHSIFRKCGVASRTELIVVLLRGRGARRPPA